MNLPGQLNSRSGLDSLTWVNTKVIFEIENEGDKTQLTFTHYGLVPEYECFEACNQGWMHYIQTSLKKYITTGIGEPNETNTPQTEAEIKLKEL